MKWATPPHPTQPILSSLAGISNPQGLREKGSAYKEYYMTEDTKRSMEEERRKIMNTYFPLETQPPETGDKKKAENGKHSETVMAKMFQLKTSHVNLTKKHVCIIQIMKN